MTATTEILDPTAPSVDAPHDPAMTLASLRGKVVGFVDNAKPNFNHLVDAMAELLTAQHGVERVVKVRKRAASIPAEHEVLDALAAQCDLVITGSGD